MNLNELSGNKYRVMIAAFAILALGFVAGGVTGYFLAGTFDANAQRNKCHYQVRQGGYGLINPLLECDAAAEAIENSELKPFKAKVEKDVGEILEKKWARDISVYFRELNDGPWFSIGPMSIYAPASLMKVPSMVAILKQAEADPEFLKKKIKFDRTDDLSAIQGIKPLKTLERGKSYTVEDLLFRMIAYSDNNSAAMLEAVSNVEILARTFRDLDIKNPYLPKPEDYASVINYSSIFRILYNASYLNRELSEKALEYLTESQFGGGLVSGVPNGIVVAHKFGEWESGENKAVKQLHDCGIIYYPGRPYLLCVMTRGDSFEHLDDSIREISRTVFEGVDKQRQNP